MAFNFFAENQDIPKERLIGKQIQDVFYSKDMTVLHLSDGHSLFIHHDTGETNLVEIAADELKPPSTNHKKRKKDSI